MAQRMGIKTFLNLSFYDVLGVSKEANAEELKKAYRQKALEHHPDKNLDDKINAQARFTRVKEAFETLSDENLRAVYDLSRSTRSAPTGASTGFTQNGYQPPPQSHFNEGFYTPPRHNPTGGVNPLLIPLYAFFSLMAILISGMYGGVVSALTGSQLPAPISRFNPWRFAWLYPGPVRERSTTIPEIMAFLMALSTHPLSVGPGPSSWFTVFGDFFECIGIEETLHGSRISTTPRFGDFSTPKNEINAFYKFWTNFETVKDFTWMSFHQVPAVHLATPVGRAQAEYENLLGRLHRKAEFEGLIRVIAEKLQKEDPRLKTFQRAYYNYAQAGNAPKAPQAQGKATGNKWRKPKKRRR